MLRSHPFCRLTTLFILTLALCTFKQSLPFSTNPRSLSHHSKYVIPSHTKHDTKISLLKSLYHSNSYNTLFSSNNKEEEPSSSPSVLSIISNESDQKLIAIKGILFSLVMLYSEYTLKNTGCGLPAGKFGFVGFIEGISYLAVVSLVALSSFSKITTGNGLPQGPGGILGIAEGLAYLAVAFGLVVLGLQITDYGYVPNAVPMDGGMCS